MRVTSRGEVVGPGTVRFVRTLPGPLERVWEFLTVPERRAQWLAGGEMDLRVGGRVELFFRHADLSPVTMPTPARFAAYEEGDVLLGTVTACQPPRLLAFTWAEGKARPSEVTFELEQAGESVRLTLTHRRLGEERAVLANVAAGWHTHLGILLDRLEGRTPQPFFAEFEMTEASYLDG